MTDFRVALSRTGLSKELETYYVLMKFLKKQKFKNPVSTFFARG
jgi:hypothetical protein